MKYADSIIPKPSSGEVLVKILAVGICGTDIHAYTGNQPYFTYPRVLGHELCGTITELGENCGDEFVVGDRVALIPYVSCGECSSCLSGKTNCCENIAVIGVHRDGGFSEFLNVPIKSILKVNGIASKTAALIEPFAISAHAVRRATLSRGEHVLVVGAGPIGVGAAAIAAADGARVVVADTQLSRREHIQKNLGPDIETLDPSEADFEQKLRNIFNGDLAATVIDATGNARAMNHSVNHIRHGGKIVFVGLFKGNLEISDPDFHKKETTMMGSRNATREDFAKVQQLMQDGKLSAEMMLTHSFAFEEIGHTYERDVINNKALLKGVIEFNE
ncbi:zinc-binding alcohol dehydrogenase family protein [Vibrio sp. PP-XX7]